MEGRADLFRKLHPALSSTILTSGWYTGPPCLTQLAMGVSQSHGYRAQGFSRFLHCHASPWGCLHLSLSFSIHSRYSSIGRRTVEGQFAQFVSLQIWGYRWKFSAFYCLTSLVLEDAGKDQIPLWRSIFWIFPQQLVFQVYCTMFCFFLPWVTVYDFFFGFHDIFN